MKKETRGRKPLSPEQRKPPQTTVKINDAILPFVQELKGNLKNETVTPEIITSLFDVLGGMDINPNNKELEQYKQSGLRLVLERDREHLRAVKLESKVKNQQSTIKTLRMQLEELRHLEYDCQVVTKSGNRCTKPAKVKTNWHGVEINTCLQHSKIINR